MFLFPFHHNNRVIMYFLFSRNFHSASIQKCLGCMKMLTSLKICSKQSCCLIHCFWPRVEEQRAGPVLEVTTPCMTQPMTSLPRFNQLNIFFHMFLVVVSSMSKAILMLVSLCVRYKHLNRYMWPIFPLSCFNNYEIAFSDIWFTCACQCL